MTIDTKEFLPAAPKGSGDEEAMGRCAAFLLRFVSCCLHWQAGRVQFQTSTCGGLNHLSELQGLLGGRPVLARGASEERAARYQCAQLEDSFECPAAAWPVSFRRSLPGPAAQLTVVARSCRLPQQN